MSESHLLPPETRLSRWLTLGRAWADRSPGRRFAFETLVFALKQAWACLFGVLLLALILATHLLWPDRATIARYDFLVLGALAIQAAMLAFRLESWSEARVIFLFHLAGTVMELFKTAQGSWLYPEDSLLRVGAVPLFSGFMYSAVGSYVARVQRLFEVRLERFPPLWVLWALAGAAYVNFFAHHWLPDMRIALFVASVLLFGRSLMSLRLDRARLRPPVVLVWLGVAFLIWVAENLATLGRAWVYPVQQAGWQPVSIAKLGAWYLLMLVSVALVALVRPPERET